MEILPIIRRIAIWLVYIYLVLFVLWLILIATPLEITVTIINKAFYDTVLIGFPLTAILVAVIIGSSRKIQQWVKWIAIPLVLSLNLMIAFASFGVVLAFMNNRSAWVDIQTLATKSDQKRIVKQRLDMGALGWAKRTVKVTRLGPFLSWSEHINELDIDQLKSEGWELEEEINKSTIGW